MRVIVEVRLDDVEPAIAVVVAGTDAHAGLRAAVGCERDAGLQSDLLERPIPVVVEEQRRAGIVRDVHVGPADRCRSRGRAA